MKPGKGVEALVAWGIIERHILALRGDSSEIRFARPYFSLTLSLSNGEKIT